MRIILLAVACANCLKVGSDKLEDHEVGSADDQQSELFRALKTSDGDNANLTKTTLESIKQNVQNYLNAFIDDKTLIEGKLYDINLASQLAVNVSKSTPNADDKERKNLILDELYAALKTRCSSGSKLLITDFARRRAQNEKASLANLVVQNANCKVAMAQPLKMISLTEDVIVSAADEPAQSGQLKDSSLAIFQDGVIVNSWPVTAIELPIEPILSLAPCFSFQYLGGLVSLCASSSNSRDQWILALTYNIFCLKDGIGRGLDSPVGSIQSAAELVKKGVPPDTAGKTSAPKSNKTKSKADPHAAASTTTTTPLPGLYNIFIGITKDTNSVISAKDRASLERELLARK